MNNEEIARLIDDRNTCENDIVVIESELRMLEGNNPDDYESLDEWNKLDNLLTQLHNEVDYLTSVIEDIHDDE